MRLETLLRIGGLLHFAILFAAALVPRVANWRENLSRVSPFMRQLVWVYGAFIALVVGGFGVLSLLHADTLAAGPPLGRTICAFIALFWLVRLSVQCFVYDASAIFHTGLLKLGYHGLTVVFIYLSIVYSLAAIFGGTRLPA